MYNNAIRWNDIHLNNRMRAEKKTRIIQTMNTRMGLHESWHCKLYRQIEYKMKEETQCKNNQTSLTNGNNLENTYLLMDLFFGKKTENGISFHFVASWWPDTTLFMVCKLTCPIQKYAFMMANVRSSIKWKLHYVRCSWALKSDLKLSILLFVSRLFELELCSEMLM